MGVKQRHLIKKCGLFCENCSKNTVEIFYYSNFRRHHFGHSHSKFRKYSLPDDQNFRKHYHKNDSKGRRISTQPEDLPLIAADRDQLDSHRSDDVRGLRRHKTSRPSEASLVHIARKDGSELQHSSLKKMYDHSPHAVSSSLEIVFL